MRAYYMLGTILGAEDKAVNKADVEPEPNVAYSLQGQTGINEMSK